MSDVESLTIYTHQPAYNTQGKGGVSPKCRALRIFNTGALGTLLPEIRRHPRRQGHELANLDCPSL